MRFPSGRPWSTLIVGLLLAGCAAAPPGEGPIRATTDGPAAPVAFTAEPWSYTGQPGAILHTPHYAIYTTATDPDLRRRLPAVMEGALGEYQRLAPGVPLSAEPMKCYVFGSRDQWVDFTRRTTGPQAYWYLKINRGGYTVGDVYAAYSVGEAATLSVAAHEGWHQFASRNFKGRLPPFLEEGIATMFEDLRWDADLPRWRLTVNRTRADALQRAVTGGYVYPLSELVQLHAGNVVGLSGSHIEAFYAQDWAFATFLFAADGGKYRPALRRLIDDTAAGTVFDPTGVHQNAAAAWNPAGVRPMLEHYLGLPLDQIEAEYQKFIRKVAFDDYNHQWE